MKYDRWFTRTVLFNCLASVLWFIQPPTIAADQPSYVGPWGYSSFNSPDWFPTENQAVASLVAWMNTSSCGTVARPVSEWADGYPGFRIDGVWTMASRSYEVKYGTVGNGCIPTYYGYGKTMYRQRTVCSHAQRFFDGRCVDISPITLAGSRPSNLGPTCSSNGSHSCGEPINTATGNMWHIETDFVDRPGGDLSLVRTYNSQSWEVIRKNQFGTRWTTAYDAKLTPSLGSTNFSGIQCFQRRDNYVIFCDSLAPPPDQSVATAMAVEVSRGDGKRYLFSRSAEGYAGAADVNDRLSAIVDSDSVLKGFKYEDAATGNTEQYDSTGLLVSISTRAGATRLLTYSDGATNDTSLGRYPLSAPICGSVHEGPVRPRGQLLCVTDSWGRQVQFRYDDKGRVIGFVDPAGHGYLYEYDGASGGCTEQNAGSEACRANNLTKVTYPGGTSHQYVYNEAANINFGSPCTYFPAVGNGFGPFLYSMTGLIDENNVRYINWTYNCRGQAKSSSLPGGVNKVEVGYYQSSPSGAPQYSQVLATTGPADAPTTVTRTFTPTPVLDVYKNGNIDESCAVCGSIRSRTFDANGNVKTATDFRGITTSYTYDLARNLETSRTEGNGTAQARTITTSWHPILRLPVKIAEPKRMTSLTYDERGNLLTRQVQGTNDTTGGAGVDAPVVGTSQIWRYTYNQFGQMTSASGPRADVTQVTTYAYDAAGNLANAVNPLGHVTTYSNYDENGHVGRITGPDGTTITFTYTDRGSVSSKSVRTDKGDEITGYEYDAIGQLVKETRPDGSWLRYAYDDAHRLTAIHDSLGNSISYALDRTGNKIRESINDPQGILVRQISRSFDILNRLQQVTGGQQ